MAVAVKIASHGGNLRSCKRELTSLCADSDSAQKRGAAGRSARRHTRVRPTTRRAGRATGA
jgi:hypothetical protein